MMKKKWLGFMAMILVVGAGVGAVLYRSLNVSAAADEREQIIVQRVDFPLLVTATGILEATRSVSIGPPNIRREHRFKLARLVDEGKVVSEGDFLLEFDGSDISRRLRDETANFQRVQEEYQKKRSDFDIQVREQRLQLEQAKADLEKLENKLSRQVELESAIVIAETKIQRDAAAKNVELLEKKLNFITESGRYDLQISRSNETHYRSRMDDLMDAMDALKVTAPVPGVVIYKRDWNNEPKQVGSFVFMLDTVLEIPDLSTLQAKVMVDEVDAGKVEVGQEARVTVDAVQGKVFTGTVTSISAILKQATYDRPQKVAEARVEFKGSDLKLLRPGMSAKSQILVGQHKDALVIPMSSIEEREGRSYVQIWNPTQQKYDWREVQLLTNDGLSAVLSSGLEANERIRAKPRV